MVAVEHHPTGHDGWLAAMFAALDAGDVDGHAGFLAPDVTVRMSGGAVLRGREAVAAAQRWLYEGLTSMHHELRSIWRERDVLTVEVDVTFTRRGEPAATVPIICVLRLSSDRLVADYRVFSDLGPDVGEPPGQPSLTHRAVGRPPPPAAGAAGGR